MAGFDTGAGSWNYLRVRGEYTCTKPAVILLMELPPRARRIRIPRPQGSKRPGTTSACAENTRKPGKPLASLRNYLRVRGEYMPFREFLRSSTELPPRARRIRPQRI